MTRKGSIHGDIVTGLSPVPAGRKAMTAYAAVAAAPGMLVHAVRLVSNMHPYDAAFTRRRLGITLLQANGEPGRCDVTDLHLTLWPFSVKLSSTGRRLAVHVRGRPLLELLP